MRLLLLVFLLVPVCCTAETSSNPCPEAGPYKVSVSGIGGSVPADCKAAFDDLGDNGSLVFDFDYQSGDSTGYGCVERHQAWGVDYSAYYKVDADPETGWFDWADVTVTFYGGVICHLKGDVYW